MKPNHSSTKSVFRGLIVGLLVLTCAGVWGAAAPPAMAANSCGNGILEGGEECDPGGVLRSNFGDPNAPACSTGADCYFATTCCKFNCQFVGTGGPCNDGNACTSPDQCNQVGACIGGGATPGQCDDHDACTYNDTCNGTLCAGTPVSCPADQCNTRTCNGTSSCTVTPLTGNSCNDGNACTQNDTCQNGTCTGTNAVTCTALDQCHDVGTCDPGTGVCSNPNKTNGTLCSDGNGCTQTDTCQNGTCTGANPVVCTASDECHTAGTCNPGTGTCSNPIKANGTGCNDSNACTQTDTCQNGTCTGGNAVVCTALDQCHDVGTCNTGTGVCSQPAKANGSACTDGNACTQGDTCQGGTCTGGSSVVCTALDQCHDVGTCNMGTGLCSSPAKANGTGCNDNNACTQTDSCQNGSCTGSNAVMCTALDQCHDVGTCNPATGTCSNPNKSNGTGCNDGDACTQTDTCQSGSCTGTNPMVCTALDQCHLAGTCNPATGMCSNPNKANGTTCNDGKSCTTGETCQNGVCTGTLNCATDQCHTVSCNGAGQCELQPLTGTPCTDGDACTLTDTCQNGTCTGGNPVTCPTPDQCHTAGTCNPSTGACSNPNKENGTLCNDSNACTQTDTCQSGTCTGSSPVVCTALDQCHNVGTCNSATGLCSNPNKTNGTACNDNDACTKTDACQNGACTGTNPVVCPTPDQCHDAATCNPSTGICPALPNKPNGQTCNDANACTLTDTCQNGTCTGSNPVTCTAQDQCHVVGTCDTGTGVCSNPNKANGTTCDDNNVCTQTDACQGGQCTGTNPLVCTAPACQVAGTCVPGSGCPTPQKQPDNTVCNDGNGCTQTDTCQSGTCIGANLKTCPSAIDECHEDGACNPATGACFFPNKPNGTACGDPFSCRLDGNCELGNCVGGRLGDDFDRDGVCDFFDNCASKANPDQADDDGDAIGNACDNCPENYNPNQNNLCGLPSGAAHLPSLFLKQVQLTASRSKRTMVIKGILDTSEAGGVGGLAESLVSGMQQPSSPQNTGFSVNLTGSSLTMPGEIIIFPPCPTATTCVGTRGEKATFRLKGRTNNVVLTITAANRLFAPPFSADPPVKVTLAYGAPDANDIFHFDRRDQIPAPAGSKTLGHCIVRSKGNILNCRK